MLDLDPDIGVRRGSVAMDRHNIVPELPAPSDRARKQLQLCRGVALPKGFLEQGVGFRLAQDRVAQLVEDSRLRTIDGVDGLNRDAGFVGDGLQRGRTIAAAPEERSCGIGDPPAGYQCPLVPQARPLFDITHVSRVSLYLARVQLY